MRLVNNVNNVDYKDKKEGLILNVNSVYVVELITDFKREPSVKQTF